MIAFMALLTSVVATELYKNSTQWALVKECIRGIDANVTYAVNGTHNSFVYTVEGDDLCEEEVGVRLAIEKCLEVNNVTGTYSLANSLYHLNEEYFPEVHHRLAEEDYPNGIVPGLRSLSPPNDRKKRALHNQNYNARGDYDTGCVNGQGYWSHNDAPADAHCLNGNANSGAFQAFGYDYPWSENNFYVRACPHHSCRQTKLVRVTQTKITGTARIVTLMPRMHSVGRCLGFRTGQHTTWGP